jgi:REP element-mobilizing transposase RayT
VVRDSRSVIIFLTVCTRHRQTVLANAMAQELMVTAWRQAGFWAVGRYVVMPDHLHLFCAPNREPEHPLRQWMSYWQNLVTRRWPDRTQCPLWQRDYWDRQVRRGESYGEKWEYVRNNPVRQRLVSRAEDWPYQGELNVLEWHD